MYYNEYSIIHYFLLCEDKGSTGDKIGWWLGRLGHHGFYLFFSLTWQIMLDPTDLFRTLKPCLRRELWEWINTCTSSLDMMVYILSWSCACFVCSCALWGIVFPTSSLNAFVVAFLILSSNFCQSVSDPPVWNGSLDLTECHAKAPISFKGKRNG